MIRTLSTTSAALLSILLIRIITALGIYVPQMQFMYFDRSFHIYHGIILSIVACLSGRILTRDTRRILLGLGLGLVVDDIAVLSYLWMGYPNDPIAIYWSPVFILPMLIGLVAIHGGEKKLDCIVQKKRP